MIEKEVANKIKQLDNIFVITDSDVDGICTGILADIILERLGKKYKIYVRPHGELDDLLNLVLENSKYDSFVMLDSPYSDDLLIKVAEENKEKKFLYIDHHKREVPKNLPENLAYYDVRALKVKMKSIGGLMYSVGKYLFGEDFKKYSIIGYISDVGDWIQDEEILRDFREAYKDRFIKGEFILYPFTILMTTYMFGNPENLVSIGKYLVEDPYSFFKNLNNKALIKSIKGFYEEFKNLKKLYESKNLLVFKSKGNASMLSSFLSIFYPEKVILVVKDHGDNIVEKLYPRKYVISARRVYPDIDLGKSVEEFTRKYGIRGGGHPAAAGGKIWKRDLDKLVEFLESV